MKRYFILVFVLLVSVLFCQDVNMLNRNSQLPRDGNRKAVQSARYLRLYDDDITAVEYLNENELTTHAKWDVTNDIDDSGGNATWTWADGDASTLTQSNANMLLQVRDNQVLQLTYEVSFSVPIAGGSGYAYVTVVCDSTAITLTEGSNAVSVVSNGSGSSGDFVINIDPDDNVTAGVFSIDDIYLTGYYESPLTIANGSSVTLTVPENAVEIIVDSYGTDISYEVGSQYFQMNTLRVIPCSGVSEIKISNSSGVTATVFFYFAMI
jgi:hypothetical protein